MEEVKPGRGEGSNIELLNTIWKAIQFVLTWPVKIYNGIMNAFDVPDFWKISIAIIVILSLTGITIYKKSK